MLDTFTTSGTETHVTLTVTTSDSRTGTDDVHILRVNRETRRTRHTVIRMPKFEPECLAKSYSEFVDEKRAEGIPAPHWRVTRQQHTVTFVHRGARPRAPPA